jgi:hypothetical protein
LIATKKAKEKNDKALKAVGSREEVKKIGK